MDDNRDAEFRRPNKILRGFSMVDQEIVSKLHEDIKSKGQEKHEIACYNFTLPDLSQFDDDFAAFLMKDLVENATLKSLEETGKVKCKRQKRFLLTLLANRIVAGQLFKQITNKVNDVDL